MTSAEPSRRDDGFLHRRIDVGEVTLHVAEARPAGDLADAPLVLLLHGFPEFWWSWRRQLEALAAAGFWAVAPDMRGYAESDKPDGVDAYRVESLASDVHGLARALGREKAFVVGHDWGGIVAWQVAQQHPELVRRLAILNAPHPVGIMRAFRRPAQLRKSWYVFYFQLPLVPELHLSARDWFFLRRTFGLDGISPEEIDRYVDAMRSPGAITAALNYYRSSIRRTTRGTGPKPVRVDCPVLVLWGDRDRYLGAELATPPPRFVPNARVVHVPEATHWVMHDAPDEVNAELTLFFRGAP